MKYRSRIAMAALTGLSFMFFCLLCGFAGHAAKMREVSRESQRKDGDALSGEWQVRCGVKIYQDGKVRSSSQDADESLVVSESDVDGSYKLFKFPAGFGEGFPRLRKINANHYAGDDTVRGITILVKQSVDLEGDGITIKHTVIDTASKQPQSEITCTGRRTRSVLTFPATASRGEVCHSTSSGQLPDKKLAHQYKSVRPFSDGLAAVANVSRGARGLKWGFIDETGRVLIPLRYDLATDFYGGLAAVGILYGRYGRGRNIKWAVVEKLGPQVTPDVYYDGVKILGEGFAAVGYANPGGTGLKWNLINRENTTILQGFDNIGCFADGRAPASYTDGGVVRAGYINKVGDFVPERK